MTPTSPPPPGRDSFGFAVKDEHMDLHTTYSPIWEEEEQARYGAWAAFLSQHAHDFSSREGPADDNGVPRIGSLEALAQLGLEVVVNVVNAGHGDQSDREHLLTLVQAGVPFQIRGQAWKAFLDISVRKMKGYYSELVHQALGELTAKMSPLTADEMRHQAALTSLMLDATDASDAAPPLLHGSWDAAQPMTEPLTAAEQTPASAGGGGARREEAAAAAPPPRWATHGHAWLQQIEKDLPRTFPGHPLMQAAGRGALRRILAAYALRNSSVGYCQGMNFVAGCLLMFMEEEDAFYCLCTVVEDILPGHYSTDMMAAQVDTRVFSRLVQDEFPIVSRHLEQLGTDLSCVVVQWFLCIFVNFLPLESCLRVWDCLFFHKSSTVLFQVALALVKIYSPALLATCDEIDGFQVMHSLAALTFDSSRLVSVASSSFPGISDKYLAGLREQYSRQVVEEQREVPNRGSVGHI